MHFSDGEADYCGYYVWPVSSPTPSPTVEPSPMPVTVENEPRVRAIQPEMADPYRVTVENFPEQQEPEPLEGAWGADQSQHLEEMHRVLVVGLSVLAFLGGAVFVQVIPTQG